MFTAYQASLLGCSWRVLRTYRAIAFGDCAARLAAHWCTYRTL